MKKLLHLIAIAGALAFLAFLGQMTAKAGANQATRIPTGTEAAQRYDLTPNQALQFRLLRAEYSNLALALELKAAETREKIQAFKDALGLGPEYIFNESDLAFERGFENAGNQ